MTPVAINARIAALEARARDADEKYRAIFENAVEGIYRSAPGGRLLIANPAMARIFGYGDVGELLALSAEECRALYADPERWLEFRRAFEERGELTGFESRARGRDGAQIWISENARAIRDAAGEVEFY